MKPAIGSVMHVVENLNMGGAERVVIDLVIEQKRRGMDCRVVCLFGQGELAGELEAEGVMVTALGKRAGLDLSALRSLRRLVAEQQPDVLHTHNAMPHYYAVMATLGLPVLRINTRHGMGDFLGNAKQQLLYRLAMPATFKVCCVCDAANRQFVDKGLIPRHKAVTVYNGLPLSRFAGSTRGTLRCLLGLAQDAPIIMTVGRLNAAKDQKALVAAFDRISNQYPDSHLVIVGDGPERPSLEALASGLQCAARIHFTGARKDVPALLADASLFALSSITEGFSIALLEAGCAALPVVATDVGGNGEIILSAQRGLLVPAGDPDALAQGMASLLAQPDMAKQLGCQLKEWVEEHCSVSAMAEHYARVYAGKEQPL